MAVGTRSEYGSQVLEEPASSGIAPTGPATVVGTPEWWRDRLHLALYKMRGPLGTLNAYYTGDHPLRFASQRYRGAFKNLLNNLSDNWCGVVVDAVLERLAVQGFRISPQPEGAPTRGDDGPGDVAAWDMWQRNNLDEGSQEAQIESLIHGWANLLVWPGADGKAVITPEHPTQTMVAQAPGDPTRRAAAIKEWIDDWTGLVMLTIYLPNGVYKWQSAKPTKEGRAPRNLAWVQRQPKGEMWPVNNPYGVVPMVPLENRARLLDRCDSEIRTLIPIQDAINKLVGDMIVASEYQAFRQRWATGLEVPVNPETNQPVEPFKAAIDRLWVSDNPDAKFGDFAQIDLTIFVKAIEMLVQHVATQSRTPPHYFYLSGQFPSGEAIKSAETGLVAKARSKMIPWGDTYEEVVRLGFLMEGDPRAKATSSETLWRDPESRSEAEHTDAMIKLKAINVPDEALWERWGFTPQEIARFKTQREEEARLMPSPAPILVPNPPRGVRVETPPGGATDGG